ncbi:MAG: sensor histidine kinase [Flavobacteriaceae bacterium]
MQSRNEHFWRSTAFRQSFAYFALLAACAGGLIAYIAWNTQVTLYRQLVETVEAEVRGLAEQYNSGGIRTLVAVVDRRSRTPGTGLYLITTFQGQRLAGNVLELPPGTLDEPGLRDTAYSAEGDSGLSRHGVVQVFILPGGFRLAVGRDTAERERFLEVVERAAWWAGALVLILGIGGGYLIARRTLSRIDAVNETSRRIMRGDLSERIPRNGSGDEFDRLSANLNDMLERISRLVAGMREVSDNIAHDLRTPLARMRGRIEASLRGGGEAEMRAALEDTVEETDRLIATFNALLTIARTESGSTKPVREPVDLAALAREIGELYEPSAEEAGFTLEIDAADAKAVIAGNRDLLAQALSNLIDNAISHGAPATGGDRDIRISVAGDAAGVSLVVADRGEGVPEADRQRVLDRFVRLEKSRSRPGSGLGLSLVGAIVALHGGDIRLEDNDPGLRVVIGFPGFPADNASP